MLDATLVVVVGLAELPMLLEPDGGGPKAATGAAATVATVLATVSLVRRRSHPLGVFTWALIVSALSAAVGLSAPVLAPFVALASVARHRRGWISLPALIAALGFATVLLATHAVAPLVVSLLVGGAATVGMWALGAYTRAHDEHARWLQRRGLELERDERRRVRLAVVEERAGIARELHDVVAHGVTVMVLQAAVARRALPADAQEARTALGEVQGTGRKTVEELGRMLELLRLDIVGGDPDPEARLSHVDALVARFCAVGLPVELEVIGSGPALSPPADLSAYRIVQEALTNALKHARATRVQVSIRHGQDGVELEVADNGDAGPRTSPIAGHGLTGIRERALLLGGSVSTGGLREHGYVVRAWLPAGPSA